MKVGDIIRVKSDYKITNPVLGLIINIHHVHSYSRVCTVLWSNNGTSYVNEYMIEKINESW